MFVCRIIHLHIFLKHFYLYTDMKFKYQIPLATTTNGYFIIIFNDYRKHYIMMKNILIIVSEWWHCISCINIITSRGSMVMWFLSKVFFSRHYASFKIRKNIMNNCLSTAVFETALCQLIVKIFNFKQK